MPATKEESGKITLGGLGFWFFLNVLLTSIFLITLYHTPEVYQTLVFIVGLLSSLLFTSVVFIFVKNEASRLTVFFMVIFALFLIASFAKEIDSLIASATLYFLIGIWFVFFRQLKRYRKISRS